MCYFEALASDVRDAMSFAWKEYSVPPHLYGEAIRSMANPGTAYDNPILEPTPNRPPWSPVEIRI
jgi:hypothetical protein